MENLGIDPKLLIAQVVNFVLFFFLFSKFIAKPFMQYIENEKKKDLERQRVAEMAVKQEEELKLHKAKMEEKMKKEFEQLVQESRKEAKELRNSLIQEAKKEAETVVLKAQNEMKSAQILMEKEMKEKVSSLSVLLVQKVLREYLTDEMQRTVTAKLITNLADSKVN